MSDVLNAMIAQAKADAAAQGVFPAIPDPQGDINSLLASVRALREVVEMLIGRRGGDESTAILRPEFESEIARIDEELP